MRNRKIPVTNTSGFKGVYFNGKKWRAQIKYEGRKYMLGNFDDPALAGEAYWKAAQRLHGEFARRA